MHFDARKVRSITNHHEAFRFAREQWERKTRLYTLDGRALFELSQVLGALPVDMPALRQPIQERYASVDDRHRALSRELWELLEASLSRIPNGHPFLLESPGPEQPRWFLPLHPYEPIPRVPLAIRDGCCVAYGRWAKRPDTHAAATKHGFFLGYYCFSAVNPPYSVAYQRDCLTDPNSTELDRAGVPDVEFDRLLSDLEASLT